MQTIVLGGGCFWCTESVFLSIKGVQSVVSGYMGGDAVSANYKDVCSGNTGHVEVIKVEFDESVVPLEVILDVFFATHDPTTMDRQGNDVGSQYRSVVFYTDEDQKPTVDRTINKLRDMGLNIVTEVHPAIEFLKQRTNIKTSLTEIRAKRIATLQYRQSLPNCVKSLVSI
ncbi:peptide-methionine (S)-S-oxide reductase MsrA [Psychrobacter alimentarius]